LKTLESYIDIKNLDKSNWKVYKFEKIANSIGERVEPTNTYLEIYVGLEHLDSDSIHIKRYGKKDDVSGTKLRCYPGDVIFGRRRAYQRKAAIVEFDGFCSAHSLVLRANPEVIDPRLFPFFLHSDTFMHRAVDISVGSLSPTINWGTLKNEEFLLPPKDQQARLAELLWAADELVESSLNIAKHLDNNFKIRINRISNSRNPEAEVKALKDVCDIKDNLRRPVNSTDRLLIKGSIPYYGANGVVDYINDYIFDEDLILIAEDGGNFFEYNTRPIAYKVTGKSWVNNHAHVLSPKKGIPIDWVYYSLVHKNIKSFIIGSTRLKLNKSDLEKIEIWIPDKSILKKYCNELQALEVSISNCMNRVNISKQLQKSLINQIF